jgi:predicted MFS family arabinose efflux permease
MARTFGVGVGSAGLVVTATQIGYAAGLVFVVPLGDLVNRRRLVLGTLAASAASLVAVAASPNLALLGVGLGVVGLTSVVAQVLIPLAATLALDAERGRVIGRVMTGVLIGILLARTASGLIAQFLGWPSVYLVASGAVALMILLLVREMPDLHPAATLSYGQALKSVMRLLTDEPVLRYRCLLGALAFASFNLCWTTLAALLSHPPYGYSLLVIGLFGLLGAAGALGAQPVGRLADMGRQALTTRVTTALVLVAWLALLLGSHYLPVVVAGVLLLDLGVQGTHISNQSQVYRLCPEARSRITTAYMTSFFIGGALGSAAGSAAIGTGGFVAVCGVGVAVSVVALVASAGARRWAL